MRAKARWRASSWRWYLLTASDHGIAVGVLGRQLLHQVGHLLAAEHQQAEERRHGRQEGHHDVLHHSEERMVERVVGARLDLAGAGARRDGSDGSPPPARGGCRSPGGRSGRGVLRISMENPAVSTDSNRTPVVDDGARTPRGRACASGSALSRVSTSGRPATLRRSSGRTWPFAHLRPGHPRRARACA